MITLCEYIIIPNEEYTTLHPPQQTTRLRVINMRVIIINTPASGWGEGTQETCVCHIDDMAKDSKTVCLGCERDQGDGWG